MLLNSDLSLNAAKRLASSVKSEAGDDPKLQVQAIYRRCLGRRARSSELELGTRFIANGDGALQDFCLSVLNLNEFIYID